MHRAVAVDFKQSIVTAKTEGYRKKQVSQEELSRDQTSTVIAFNHVRTNSSLILRCKTIFHEVVPKCPDTSAPVPKCSGSEVSVTDVLTLSPWPWPQRSSLWT